MKSSSQFRLLTLCLIGFAGLAGCTGGTTDTSQTDAGADAADVSSNEDAANDAENEINDVDATPDTGSTAPLITSFTVDGATSATVDQGDQVQVSWASVNTSGCTAGGTLPSWSSLGTSLVSSDTVQVTTSGLANGSYTLTLNCASSQGAISAPNNPLMVVVENSTSAGDCSTRPAVSLTRATEIVYGEDDDALLFESVFGSFPGSGNSQPVRLPKTMYAAMEFTTDGTIAPDAFGAVQHAVMQPLPDNTASGAHALRLWSISRCPGDFRKQVLDSEMGPGCAKGGTASLDDQGSFKFGGSHYRTDTGVCALEANTTYFLNLMYTDQPPPTTEQEHEALTGTCPEDFCGNGMQPHGNGF